MLLQRVTTELDRGPTVTWCRYPISGREFDNLWQRHGASHDEQTPLFRAIRAAGVMREPIFILESLQAIAEGAALPEPQATSAGVEITDIVERRLAEGPASRSP